MWISLTSPSGLLTCVVLCSVALVSASFAPAQEGQETIRDTEEPPVENALNRQRRLIREKQTAEMLGAWQLLRYETAGAVVSSSEISGNALIADGFFSLVIHATGYEEETGEQFDMAQAGIFRFEVSDFSDLRSLTVIGHATPPGIDPAEAEFALIEEQVGGMREYRLVVQKDKILMQHFSGTKLTFLRMPPTGLSAPEIARLGQELSKDSEAKDEKPGEEPQVPLEEQLHGGWFLTGYLAGGVPVSDDTITGAALINDGYMSLVIHANDFLVDEKGLPLDSVLLAQAGIYRYRVKDSKLLQTSTVIGHSNPDVDVDYEYAGGLREYEASLEDNTLILRGIGGTALRFVRMTPRKFTDLEEATFNRYGRGLDLVEDG